MKQVLTGGRWLDISCPVVLLCTGRSPCWVFEVHNRWETSDIIFTLDCKIINMPSLVRIWIILTVSLSETMCSWFVGKVRPFFVINTWYGPAEVMSLVFRAGFGSRGSKYQGQCLQLPPRSHGKLKSTWVEAHMVLPTGRKSTGRFDEVSAVGRSLYQSVVVKTELMQKTKLSFGRFMSALEVDPVHTSEIFLFLR